MNLFKKTLLTCSAVFLICSSAGAEMIHLQKGQKLQLQNGSFLTLNQGQLQLVNQTNQVKSFPQDAKIEKMPNGQVLIWGTGGTTLWRSDPQPDIPGAQSFDDPLFKPKSFDDPLFKPKGFDDPLFKPKSFDDPLFKPAAK